jgi:hypothetical protein
LREFRIGRLFLCEDVPPDYPLRQRRSRPVSQAANEEVSVSASSPTMISVLAPGGEVLVDSGDPQSSATLQSSWSRASSPSLTRSSFPAISDSSTSYSHTW